MDFCARRDRQARLTTQTAWLVHLAAIPVALAPHAIGLLNLPRFLRVPAEMEIHRRDLDRANGVPNRGGMCALIGPQFDPAQVKTPRAG